jgi:excisionase family DNA binding protein
MIPRASRCNVLAPADAGGMCGSAALARPGPPRPAPSLSLAPKVAQLLTSREVAGRLAVSVSMVRKLARRGELKAVYIGRLPRFDEGDVAAYLERRCARSAGR